eukprot:c12211_g1_i1 orf=318-1499(+)
MEIKGSMGLPPSGPGGMAGSFNGMHAKGGGDMQAHEMHTHTHTPSSYRVDGSRSMSTPIMVSPPIAVTPLASAPLPYMPDMSSAMLSHTAALASMGGTHSHLGFSGSDPMKKKRGRPRKYGPDGTVSIVIKPFSSPTASSPMSPLQKRGRGRPPGSGKNQQLAALGEMICGSAGAGFTPHAITVATGEDVAARIMSFSQQGPRGICILSANGAISNVTLRQPSTSGGTVTYEGRFEILSLSGSFLVTDSGGTRSRTGGLSVSLAGPDGRVVGGGVAGMLMAASPVQVVVGSFMCGGTSKKVQSKQSKDGASKLSTSGTPKAEGGNAAPELSMNDMADMKPDSPGLNQSSGNGASSDAESPQGQMIAVHSSWPVGHGVPEGRRNIEIDMSSPGQ